MSDGILHYPDLELFFTDSASEQIGQYHAVIKQGLLDRFQQYQHGHLKTWRTLIDTLPVIADTKVILDTSVSVQSTPPLASTTLDTLKQSLLELHPWRKGPFHIHGLTIDCEWRSDWKWQRIQPHISLENKTVLDIGCGNGYYAWRMLGAGAKLVLGIDPSQLFWHQFLATKHFLGDYPAYLLPIGIQHLPNRMPIFDTVFSMGVFYHRKSPFEHLSQIRELLSTNGEMVLETLVVGGNDETVLVPGDRYACMPNVWFIPSVQALTQWIKKAGFRQVRCVDINQTSLEEQRQTEWMTYQSLADFLDPSNKNLTREGYPAPTRAVFIAQK